MNDAIALDLLLLVAPPIVAILLFRDAIRAWRPTRLFVSGRYAEARRAWERLGRSWMRVLPRVRSAARYGVAASLHMTGDFAGSLATLEGIDRDRLDPNLRYAVASLEAANLVLVRRDPSRAIARLESVAAIHQPPEDLLLLAHAKRALGDGEAAEALFRRAGDRRGAPQTRLGRTILLERRAHHDAIFHALRGLYLLDTGRAAEAEADFARAADVPLVNWYTDRARSLLPAARGDGEPRSSLAPQVLEETGRVSGS